MIPQPERFEYQSKQPQNDGKKPHSNRDKEGIKSLLSTLGIIIAAPLIALLLINYVFQSYEVDGPSMQDTLHDGDRLIVLKAGKTIANIKDQPYIPDRYSIIIFESNEINDLSSDKQQLVKRVIGLPGERIVVRDGKITVYNTEHPQGFNPDIGTEYEKNLPNETPGNVDITVPAGEVFVSGDNRTNSKDSRYFGTVPAESIVGELILRIFPLGDFEAY